MLNCQQRKNDVFGSLSEMSFCFFVPEIFTLCQNCRRAVPYDI